MEKVTPMVSVIIPVYNAVKYLPETLRSVVNQTFKNFELILIDDGANDGSGQICDEFAKTDSRIIVIHQKNGGICKARNTGLSVAKGKYIAFCDHDDLYEPIFLEKAVDEAEEKEVDLVKFTYKSEIWKNGRKLKTIVKKCPSAIVDTSDLVNQYTLFNLTVRGIWNGLYLRKIIEENKIRFDENIKTGMEDYLFNLEILKIVRQVAVIEDTLFIHFARYEQSTSEKYDARRYRDIVYTANVEKMFLKTFKCIKPENWIKHQCLYLILYMRTLTHPENKVSNIEKIKRLKSLEKKGYLELNCKKICCFKVWKLSLKEATVSILFNFKMIPLLLIIYNSYRNNRNYGV